jgi:hypothetical protein
VGGAKALLAFPKYLRRDAMLRLHLRMTTAEEICDGVVAMGETLLFYGALAWAGARYDVMY